MEQIFLSLTFSVLVLLLSFIRSCWVEWNMPYQHSCGAHYSKSSLALFFLRTNEPQIKVTLQRSRFFSYTGIQVNVLTVKLNIADCFKAPTVQYLWKAFIYVCQCIKYLLLWIWAHDFVKMDFIWKNKGFLFRVNTSCMEQVICYLGFCT